MNPVTVRMAKNEEGDTIKGFAFEVGFVDKDIDWSNIEPYWLVAEMEGMVIGTIQVCPSRPIGRLEVLYVIPEVKNELRRIAVTMLMMTGIQTLRENGAQLVGGLVDLENKSFEKFLETRGASTALTGKLMIWRI